MLKPNIFEANLNYLSDISHFLKFCDELFIQHQVALMHKNYESAFLYFEQLFDYRMSVLDFMHKYALPYYCQRVNPLPAGGKKRYFLREKKLLEKHLSKYMRFFNNLVFQNEKKIDIVNLFEEYMSVKDLLDHHDARENGILYPALENALTDYEKKEIIEIINKSIHKKNRKWLWNE